MNHIVATSLASPGRIKVEIYVKDEQGQKQLSQVDFFKRSQLIKASFVRNHVIIEGLNTNKVFEVTYNQDSDLFDIVDSIDGFVPTNDLELAEKISELMA